LRDRALNRAVAASTTAERRNAHGVAALAGAALIGAAVSLLLGVYGRHHHPAGQALFTLGFSSTLSMKAWLATVVVILAVAQIALAMWMYGKLGLHGAPKWVGPVHRLVGLLAFLVSLPIAYHCLWSLGFEANTSATRRFVHSVLGCAFYGAFATKMICLRSRRMPDWALPLVGGTIFTILVGIWLTSSLWYFRNTGLHH
jgi:hypothetical protein